MGDALVADPPSNGISGCSGLELDVDRHGAIPKSVVFHEALAAPIAADLEVPRQVAPSPGDDKVVRTERLRRELEPAKKIASRKRVPDTYRGEDETHGGGAHTLDL